MKFTRFTPAHQPGDVFVRDDVVTSVQPNAYQAMSFSGKPLDVATAISTTGGGTVIVKESPAQVIAALDDADIPDEVECDIEIDGDTLLMWSEELQRIHAIKLKPIETPLHDKMRIAKLAHERDEALADAKIADERAEWYRKVAESTIADRDKALRDAAYYKQIADSRLDMLGHKQSELDRYATEIGTEIAKSANLRDERDQLLAKLKDTTAALEKANCELNVARYDKFWRGDGWSKNGFIGNVTGLPKPD